MKLTKDEMKKLIYDAIHGCYHYVGENPAIHKAHTQSITDAIFEKLDGGLTNIDNTRYIIIGEDEVQTLCGILSYDIALNKAAKEVGFHPVSHFPFNLQHENFAHRNERLIRMLGGEVTDIPRELIKALVEKDVLTNV